MTRAGGMTLHCCVPSIDAPPAGEVSVRSVSAALLLATLFASSAAQAQTPSATPSGSFEKKNYNYSPWTKGLFSEVVTVTHPEK